MDMEFIVTFLYMLLGSFCSRENIIISNCSCQIHVAEVQFKYNSEFTYSTAVNILISYINILLFTAS